MCCPPHLFSSPRYFTYGRLRRSRRKVVQVTQEEVNNTYRIFFFSTIDFFFIQELYTGIPHEKRRTARKFYNSPLPQTAVERNLALIFVCCHGLRVLKSRITGYPPPQMTGAQQPPLQRVALRLFVHLFVCLQRVALRLCVCSFVCRCHGGCFMERIWSSKSYPT